ncbi:MULTISPECIES: hypothetical protein [Clostridium]|uniref:Spore coat protein n=1 Tax=Clostridium frigoriphilum TaxID=443253 RepID=A0ABU7UWW2_9CLOT|nr:hypothetical protein [Clostridium sp. DSM 17811]MBU3098728.1 hypothetical protein [Clostridium sp. DSM 17811]
MTNIDWEMKCAALEMKVLMLEYQKLSLEIKIDKLEHDKIMKNITDDGIAAIKTLTGGLL